jgi:PAS domain S-box-containing protein
MAMMRRPIELMTTLEKVNIPSFVTDRAGMVTWLNEAARTAFGDVKGRPLSELVAPEYVPLVQRQLRRKLEDGVPVTDYVVEVITADGRRRRAEISSVAIAHGDDAHAIFGVARPGPLSHPSRVNVELTPRQHEVLQLLAKGASTDAIAARLHLSRETVRNHIRAVLRALGAHSRLEAVAIAHRRGLVGDE